MGGFDDGELDNGHTGVDGVRELWCNGQCGRGYVAMVNALAEATLAVDGVRSLRSVRLEHLLLSGIHVDPSVRLEPLGPSGIHVVPLAGRPPAVRVNLMLRPAQIHVAVLPGRGVVNVLASRC